MRASFEANGDLRITMSPEERAELRDLSNELGTERFWTDDTMLDVLEPFTCNSEYDWVHPVEVAALTEAPILGTRDENYNPVEVWWYPNYMVQSPLCDLLNCGFVVFTKAEAWED